jgi:hypothetical protein
MPDCDYTDRIVTTAKTSPVNGKSKSKAVDIRWSEGAD